MTARRVSIGRSFATSPRPSARGLEVASIFGLGLDDEERLEVVPPCEIPLPRGGIVFVTGPSGGGKSTVLDLLADEIGRRERVIEFDRLVLREDQPLVDQFDGPLAETLAVLSRAGLADAFVFLRTPRELSDGQRVRLRLALAFAEAAREERSATILVDEFAATLDRLTAHLIAGNVRRWITHTPHTFIAATTHDDLLESLDPDVLVYKDLGGVIEVIERETQEKVTTDAH